MEELEFRQWAERNHKPVLWLVSIDDEIMEEPMTLDDVYQYKKSGKVLLCDPAQTGNPEWIEVELAGKDALFHNDPNASKYTDINKAAVVLAIIAMIAIGPIIYGLYLAGGYFYKELGKLDPEDIEVIENEPRLEAIAIQSRRAIQIINVGEEEWPALSVRARDKNGAEYKNNWTQPIPAGKALNIPYRKLIDEDRRSYDASMGPIASIEVTVEGYDTFQHKFEQD